MSGIETAAGILLLLTVACVAVCGHFLQQIRDELREMNGKKGGANGATTVKSGGGYARR